MPLVKGKLVTPEAAIAQNLCPECGVDLTKVNPIAELKSHWHAQPRDNRQGAEALRRQNLLKDFIAKNKVRTSNMPPPVPIAAAAPAAGAKP